MGLNFYSLALPSVPYLSSQLFCGLRGGGDHIAKKARSQFSMKMEAGEDFVKERIGKLCGSRWYEHLMIPQIIPTLFTEFAFK